MYGKEVAEQKLHAINNDLIAFQEEWIKLQSVDIWTEEQQKRAHVLKVEIEKCQTEKVELSDMVAHHHQEYM